MNEIGSLLIELKHNSQDNHHLHFSRENINHQQDLDHSSTSSSSSNELSNSTTSTSSTSSNRIEKNDDVHYHLAVPTPSTRRRRRRRTSKARTSVYFVKEDNDHVVNTATATKTTNGEEDNRRQFPRISQQSSTLSGSSTESPSTLNSAALTQSLLANFSCSSVANHYHQQEQTQTPETKPNRTTNYHHSFNPTYLNDDDDNNHDHYAIKKNVDYDEELVLSSSSSTLQTSGSSGCSNSHSGQQLNQHQTSKNNILFDDHLNHYHTNYKTIGSTTTLSSSSSSSANSVKSVNFNPAITSATLTKKKKYLSHSFTQLSKLLSLNNHSSTFNSNINLNTDNNLYEKTNCNNHNPEQTTIINGTGQQQQERLRTIISGGNHLHNKQVQQSPRFDLTTTSLTGSNNNKKIEHSKEKINPVILSGGNPTSKQSPQSSSSSGYSSSSSSFNRQRKNLIDDSDCPSNSSSLSSNSLPPSPNSSVAIVVLRNIANTAPTITSEQSSQTKQEEESPPKPPPKSSKKIIVTTSSSSLNSGGGSSSSPSSSFLHPSHHIHNTDQKIISTANSQPIKPPAPPPKNQEISSLNAANNPLINNTQNNIEQSITTTQPENNCYSELLRYRSQEFFQKVAANNKQKEQQFSQQQQNQNFDIIDLATPNLQYNSLSRLATANSSSTSSSSKQSKNLALGEINSCLNRITKEFESLRDLTKWNEDYQSTGHSHQHYKQQTQQTTLVNGGIGGPSAYHVLHHPHYLNHLNNHHLSTSSLLRSNSSLSLSYYQRNQQQQHLSKYPGNTGHFVHNNHNLIPTLSTTNLSTCTSGWIQQPSSTAATIVTIDRRQFRSNNGNGMNQSMSNSHNSSKSITSKTTTVAGGGGGHTPTPPTSTLTSTSTTTLTAKMMVSSQISSSSSSTATINNGPTTSMANSTECTNNNRLPVVVGRQLLTRSTSSGLPVTDQSNNSQQQQLQPIQIQMYPQAPTNQQQIYGHQQHYASNIHHPSVTQHHHNQHQQNLYNSVQSQQHPMMNSQMNSRSSTSLATMATTTNQNNNNGQYNNIYQVQPMTTKMIHLQQQQKPNGGLTVITPITTTSTTHTSMASTAIGSYQHRLTQRFPIVALSSSTTTTTTTTVPSSNISTIGTTNVDQNHPFIKCVVTNANVQTTSTTTIATYQQHPPLINSLSRSFFNSTNIFETKKNKLFGSVSSIDLQCLKESQKVSVIERKSSSSTKSGGRPTLGLKSSSSSSSSSHQSSSNATGSSGSGGGGASSFFKLFTSASSKAKIPSFGFSSNSSNNNNNANNNNSDSHHGSGSGSISSNSSVNTVTIRADSMMSNVGGESEYSMSNGGFEHPYGMKHHRIMNGERLTIKSISVDSATITDGTQMTSSTPIHLLEPSPMPANEVLFRKYFTFYDLLSSLNLHRLFLDNAGTNLGSVPSSSLLDLNNHCHRNGTNSSNTAITNGNQNGQQPVTTFESSTLSSTSSYSSCTSSMSNSSHQNNNNNTNATNNPNSYHSLTKNCPSFPIPNKNQTQNSFEIGNELLAPSPNFLNEIGSEKQYSIELTWNNGFKEEIPLSMLNQQQHGEQTMLSNGSQDLMTHHQPHNGILRSATLASTESTSSSQSLHKNQINYSISSSSDPSNIKQLHPPPFSKRINIFSDASPFAALTQHSVMSDLYGGGGGGSGGSGTMPNHPTTKSNKSKLDLDFNDLDDGFGSLSSASLSSTYPIISQTSSSSSYTLSSHFVHATSRCPFSPQAETCNVLEMDYGTSYYRTHFRDFEHQNWLQIHDKYGPIIVSLRKERVKNSNHCSGSGCSSYSSSSSSSSSSTSSTNVTIRWRVIVRTTSLIPLRGTIAALPSICLPGGVPGSGSLDSNASNSSNRRNSSNSDSFNINSVRDVLLLVVPKSVNVSNFRLGSPTVISQLLKLDEMSQNTEYKIGVLYAYGNQHSEEEFYNNILDYSTSSRSPFYDFMGLIASRVRLKEFKGYKAGLDVLNDTTGEYSWTAKFGHTEIMFHVCTELPFNSTNRQQLPRKRHIGNDIVTIVFLHENFTGSPFTPALIRSKFQQVFIIVKPVQNGKYFRVAVARHKLVPLFGPPLKPYYTRQELRDFILTKIINAENACHSVNKFAEMAKRTRHEYLMEMCQKHSLTQTVAHVDSSLNSNSLHSFKKLLTLTTNSSSSNSGEHPSKHRCKSEIVESSSHPQFPYAGHILNGIKDPPTLNGAILFSERCAGSTVPSRLYVHDYYANRDVEVSLLLSNEAILVIEAATMEVIWAVPVTSIIGWTDSRGVFATSPTNCVVSTIDIRQNGGKFGDKKSKSMDSEPSLNNSTSRELRLYYHQGECIHIMQRPINSNLVTTNEPTTVNNNLTVNGKQSSKHQQQNQANLRNNDPFLMLIRVLELITRKSELRAIVIKRKSSCRSAKSSVANTPEHRKPSPPSIEPLGSCGGDFGFQMKMATGVVEEIFDQTLSDYHLVPGCKIIEIDKISFAAMSMDELSELVNSSLIMCLTFTGFDFGRLQPRCNCPWPKQLQLQHKQKSQQTPPSDYENLSTNSKTTTISPSKQQASSGVKTIQITHNNDNNSSMHQMMNVSSTPSSNSSYYSTQTANSNSNNNNQSPSHNNSANANNFSILNHHTVNHQHLYSAKSASSLNQLYQQQQPSQASPIKMTAQHSLSATSSPAAKALNRSSTINGGQQTAITTQPSTLKDNLIRLITMDDYSINGSSASPTNVTTPSADNSTIGSTFDAKSEPMLPLMLQQQQKPTSTNSTPNHHYYTYYERTGTRPSIIGQSHQYRGYIGPQPDTTAEATYGSYASSSRYSTASSAQYSSLGRNVSSATATSGTQTIHLTSNHNTTVPVISGQQQHMMMIRTGPYGKEATSTTTVSSTSTTSTTTTTIPVENNQQQPNADCYLLTAQPVRVVESGTNQTNSNSTTSGQINLQQYEISVTGNSNTPPSSASGTSSTTNSSYDCNNLYSSLGLSGPLGLHSDPIGDIVWPSMHNSLDHQTYIQNIAKYNTSDNISSQSINCDSSTGSSSKSASAPTSATTHNAAAHLTEEVRKLSLEKDVLNDTITKLREENQRLHMESQTASQQLRKLTEWFFSSSNPASPSKQSANVQQQPTQTGTGPNVQTSSNNSSNTTTISIQQTSTSSQPSSPNH